jgi:hypothetical protein
MPCLNKWYACILMLFFPLTAACQLWYEDLVACLLWTDTQTEAHIERWEVSYACLIIKFFMRCHYPKKKTAVRCDACCLS